jgi:ABC-type sulfate/molybdate transport systems ATPase subunit
MLTVRSVSKKIKNHWAVNNISLQLQPLEKLAIAGETGSGKTSLLKMIGGLMQPDKGDVLLNGERVPGPDEKLIPGHAAIAYLSQHFELLNNYWVYEVLEMINQLPQDKANLIYSLCDIKDLLHRRTDQLSGGEKQRIALARQLSKAPQLLLLDEPFSNLDAHHKQQLKAVIENVTAELQMSCILVSHDAQDVLPWANRLLILQHGQIIQQGIPQQVYEQPVSAYCGGLLGAGNSFSSDSSLAGYLGIIAEEATTVFIRPQWFLINTQTTDGVKAIVLQNYYYGNYTLTEVLAAGETLLIAAGDMKLDRGALIYLQPRQDKIIFFKK